MRLTRTSLALAALLAPAVLLAPRVALSQSAPITIPAAPRPPSAQPAAPAATPAPAAKVELLDINSATAEQLDALPGIGAVRTAAIIKGRPYKGKDELVQKGIVPKNVYDAIKDKIVARQK